MKKVICVVISIFILSTSVCVVFAQNNVYGFERCEYMSDGYHIYYDSDHPAEYYDAWTYFWERWIYYDGGEYTPAEMSAENMKAVYDGMQAAGLPVVINYDSTYGGYTIRLFGRLHQHNNDGSAFLNGSTTWSVDATDKYYLYRPFGDELQSLVDMGYLSGYTFWISYSDPLESGGSGGDVVDGEAWNSVGFNSGISMYSVSTMAVTSNGNGFSGGTRPGGFSGGGFSGGSNSGSSSTETVTTLSFDALSDLCAEINIALTLGNITFDSGVTSLTLYYNPTYSAYYIVGYSGGTTYALCNNDGLAYCCPAVTDSLSYLYPFYTLASNINSNLAVMSSNLDANFRNLYGYVDGLEETVTIINSNIATFSSNTDANFRTLFGYVDDLESSATTISDNVVTLLTNSNTIVTEITKIRGYCFEIYGKIFTSLDSNVSSTNSNIATLVNTYAKDMSADVANIEWLMINSVQSHLDTIDDDLSTLVTNSADVVTLTDTIEANVVNLRQLVWTYFPTFDTALNNIYTRLDSMDSREYVDEVESKLDVITTTLTTQNGYVDEVESKLDSLVSPITQMAETFNLWFVIPEDMDEGSLPFYVQVLGEFLGIVDSDFNMLYSHVDEVGNKLISLESTMTSQHEDIVDYWALLEQGLNGWGEGQMMYLEGCVNLLIYLFAETDNWGEVVASYPKLTYEAVDGLETTLSNIYDRLGDIEDAVISADNVIIDITTDNDAFNIFYITKTDGTTESVGDAAKDAAKVVGEFLSVFYRLIFADGLENADIIHDFEEVYTVTDSGVSVW